MPNLKDRLREAEAAIIVEALDKAGGNVKAAAEELGVPLRTLFYKIERLDLDPNDYRIRQEKADKGK
jgi:sigma-54-dependent transcriptional regulator